MHDRFYCIYFAYLQLHGCILLKFIFVGLCRVSTGFQISYSVTVYIFIGYRFGQKRSTERTPSHLLACNKVSRLSIRCTNITLFLQSASTDMRLLVWDDFYDITGINFYYRFEVIQESVTPSIIIMSYSFMSSHCGDNLTAVWSPKCDFLYGYDIIIRSLKNKVFILVTFRH